MKNLLFGILCFTSFSAFADCRNISNIEKACIQEILDQQVFGDKVIFETIELSASIVKIGNQTEVGRCFYTYKKEINLPNESFVARIVGQARFSKQTCQILEGSSSESVKPLSST